MGQVLEVVRGAQLDKVCSQSGLAAALLGYAIAEERKLRSEMELRCRESSSGRIGCKVGRLVISGGVERTTMVTTLEGRALSRPKHKRKGTLEGGRSSFKVWDDTAVGPSNFLKRG